MASMSTGNVLRAALQCLEYRVRRKDKPTKQLAAGHFLPVRSVAPLDRRAKDHTRALKVLDRSVAS